MKKIRELLLGVFCCINSTIVFAAEKFDILPDLPEPIAAAQASSVSTTNTPADAVVTHSIGQEPNILSVIFSLIFVILLIYVTGIIYTKLNKVGFKVLKKQISDMPNSKVAVVSTTPLGGNRALHVVELDGKRMLIGASPNSIQLLKDLGSTPSIEISEKEYSRIEIPNIRIPKIEIPKIEFPNIGFTKASPKVESDSKNEEISQTKEQPSKKADDNDDFEISDIYEEGPDGIIDKLFQTSKDNADENQDLAASHTEHSVEPDEYALYKKYL